MSAPKAEVFASCADGKQVLKRFGSRNLLFCEERQAIYEVDDLSAFVWEASLQGSEPSLIIDEMVNEGIDRTLAREMVRECLNRLQRLKRA